MKYNLETLLGFLEPVFFGHSPEEWDGREAPNFEDEYELVGYAVWENIKKPMQIKIFWLF